MSSYYGQQQQGNFYSGGNTFGEQQPPTFDQQSQQQHQQQWNSSDQPQVAQQQTYGNQQQTPFFGQPQQQQSAAYGQQQPSMMGASSMLQAATLMGAAAASNGGQQAAIEAGKRFLESEVARMIPGLEALMLSLRNYFAVDNYYVKVKMQRVLFPFTAKSWKRQERPRGTLDAPVVYDLPHVDINAPDMYIPFMSLITYALLCAVVYGSAGKFNPEVLPDIVSKCLLLQALEIAVLKIGCVYNETPISLLDSWCYTGYKYLGLVFNMLSGILFLMLGVSGAKKSYYVSFLYTSAASAWFLIKTVSHIIPVNRKQRQIVILAVAGLTCATMWIVSDTKFMLDAQEAVTTASSHVAKAIEQEVSVDQDESGEDEV